MVTPRPEISIIIPYFNGQRFIGPALQSIHREGLPNLEVILVDDASTDRGIPDVSGNSCCILKKNRNGGPASAQNAGIRVAKGKYITFLDQDDVLVQGSIRARWNWLTTHAEDRVVSGSMAEVIDESGEIIGAYADILHPRYRAPGTYITRQFIDSGLICPPTSSLFMYRRDLLEQVGDFDESYKTCHDADYLFRVLEVEKIRFLDVPILHHRLHSNNLSVKREGNQNIYSKHHLGEIFLISTQYGLPFF